MQVYVSVRKKSGHFHRFTPVHGSDEANVGKIGEGSNGIGEETNGVDAETAGSECEKDEVGRSWPPSDSLCLLLCCRRGPQDEPEDVWGSRDGAEWYRREQPPQRYGVTKLGESRAHSHLLLAHCDRMFFVVVVVRLNCTICS